VYNTYIHVYIIILTCGRNERNTNHTQTRMHTRLHPQFSSTRVEKTKVFGPMSRKVDLDIIFFRARNRIISWNFSYVSLLEKNDLIVRSIHAIVFVFYNNTFQLSIQHGYERYLEFLHTYLWFMQFRYITFVLLSPWNRSIDSKYNIWIFNSDIFIENARI